MTGINFFPDQIPGKTPEEIQKLNFNQKILTITTCKDLQETTDMMYEVFGKVRPRFNIDKKELKKRISKCEYKNLVALEIQCPGFIERLSQKYSERHRINSNPASLESHIQNDTTEDNDTVLNLYPVRKLLLKEEPSQEDQDLCIQELQKNVDQHSETMEGSIVKGNRNFLLGDQTKGSHPTAEAYKDHIRRKYRQGDNSGNEEVQWMKNNPDKIKEEAIRQHKPEREINIVLETIKLRTEQE